MVLVASPSKTSVLLRDGESTQTHRHDHVQRETESDAAMSQEHLEPRGAGSGRKVRPQHPCREPGPAGR